MNVEKKGCETNKVNADNAVERFEFLDAIFRIAVTKVSEEKRRGKETRRRRGEGERRGEKRRREEKRERKDGRPNIHCCWGMMVHACVCGVMCVIVIVPSSFLS